jgi:serine/threonine protein kinase
VNRGRFRREIQVAAQLQHPHIVPLLSAGEHEDLLYFTMPFIAGESLKSAVEKYGSLPVVDVVRILYDVAEALDYAHAQGVVHRDIKPANILRSGSYSLITDFGVAKALNAATTTSGMTATGMAVGTPAYMSPEQLAGDSAADHRIDIYALGLLAYELLHGKSPFAASTPQRVLAAVLTQEPKPLIEVRPDVPRSLSDLVMRSLSKDPIERPPSARQVLDSLDMFSTASGEIRTMEHKVPRAERMTPTAMPVVPEVPGVPSLEPTLSDELVNPPKKQVQTFEPDPLSVEFHDVGYAPPKKSRSKIFVGAIAVLIPLAIIAFFLLQRSGNAPVVGAAATSPPLGSVINNDSVSTVPGTTTPAGTTAESAAAAPAVVLVDSTAIKDSIRRARREAARKAAALKDSLQKASPAPENHVSVANARIAASAMLADPRARKAFEQGATHMGGVFGAKRKGDLQTQIDALQPFLSNGGLTYQQFKSIVQESGIRLYDEFGRMLPAALQQFANQSR